MDTKQLRKWAEKYDVEKKTIEGFWYYINSFEKEEGEPFFDGNIDKSQLNLTLNNIGLFIDAWSKDSYRQYGYDYIISYLPVIHKEDHLGTYKMFFNLNGEICDDSFSPF
ncbi:hypothetical protein [Peribacillus loiseleuriae]|uniref:Uncharacterized protein n=1 Tax=Peribacillus loiseleuriae TaxID=1679170 RepID=A0A0K9GTK3_9BACI|nr:hypothetical protein [Peribacillus loiseleuriae]KMY49999.1 hypothetical protein AC625_11150 [Peribacillus loiseleuriae]